MREDSAKILRRKIECSGRDPGPLELVADLGERIGGQAAAAFSEYYGEKCQLAQTAPAEFCALNEKLSSYGSQSAIYHFRESGGSDFILILELDTTLRAAGWSLSGARDLPAPKPEGLSAIDRRLAKKLAIRTAEVIFENAESCGVVKGSVELLASGGDPRRFEFTDDTQKMVFLSLSAQTIEGEELGVITILAPEKSLTAMRRHYETTMVLAAKQWQRDLVRLALSSPVLLRAKLTEQDIDIDRLMNLAPGQVIDLTTATIDEVEIMPALRTKSKLTLKGALGNRDGARALRLTAVDI